MIQLEQPTSAMHLQSASNYGFAAAGQHSLELGSSDPNSVNSSALSDVDQVVDGLDGTIVGKNMTPEAIGDKSLPSSLTNDLANPMANTNSQNTVSPNAIETSQSVPDNTVLESVIDTQFIANSGTNETLLDADPLADLASLVSHELRTPLTSIQGVLGLLERGYLGALSEEGQRLVHLAIVNADRLTRLAQLIEQDHVNPVTILSKVDLDQLQLENDLHRALERKELELHYQPIVAGNLSRIKGFEALIRWKHVRNGFIPPSVFIPIAERTGLIHELGLWILHQACMQLEIWQQQYSGSEPLTMSVNMSTIQLLKPDLVERIGQILDSVDISPNSLKLEITESVLIENHADAIATLGQLRELGVQLYIDDFGTGYSSLARLADLPLDALKIDQSFISSQRWDLCETIILLAQKLGLDVIAEGIEKPEELSVLQGLGCQYMQGYLFSKPVAQETALRLIRSTRWK